MFLNTLRFRRQLSRKGLPLFIVWLTVLSSSLLVVSQQLDPVRNLCSRWDHQSAFLDGTLYIDGGVQVFVDITGNGSKILGTQHVGINRDLLALDMTRPWNWWGSTMPFRLPAINGSTQPPPLIGGALWPYGNSLYLYGGTTSRLNDSSTSYSPPTSDDTVMWRYDPLLMSWDPVQLPPSQVNFPRLSSGASIVAPDQGVAFHLGGEMDNGTSPETEGNGVRFVNRFWVYNFTDGGVRDLAMGVVGGRVNAQMVHIPEVGEKGVLVLMGGGFGSNDQLAPMSEIGIFDIASINTGESDGGGTWYNQTATGDIPNPRRDFCIVVVSAPDLSSHNIYLYGGWNGSRYFDDVYILSIPSFRWIKIFEGSDQRISHSCHVVGNRQLMTIGGRRVTNLPGECDWEPNSIALYDMVALNWAPAFLPDGQEWELPRNVTNVIGGDARGGADVTAPAVWASGLDIVFSTQVLTSPTPPPPSPESSRTKLSRGAIVGLSIGIALFVLIFSYTFIRLSQILAAKPNFMSRSPPPPAELHNTISLSAFQELLGSLGKPKRNSRAVELEAELPKYTRARDSNGDPFELPGMRECDRNSLAEVVTVEKPAGEVSAAVPAAERLAEGLAEESAEGPTEGLMHEPVQKPVGNWI